MGAISTLGLRKGIKLISAEIGILSHILKLPRMQSDPKLVSFGVWPGDSRQLGGKRFSGRSSGCGYNWKEALLTTLGEVSERYCPAFYNRDQLVFSSYNALKAPAIHPGQLALYHEKQYAALDFPLVPFTEDSEVFWTPCWDLSQSKEVLYPASMIYIPWVEEEEWITVTSSTGMAGHTDLYSAILSGLYENIERDSFVLTWMQLLDAPKILITPEIKDFINDKYPNNYEFHFLDVTYDIEVPSVFGFCFGVADFGPFVAVGSATRSTYAEALIKVTTEIGQAISYFRYLLGEMQDWKPSDDFNEIMNFEEHSLFYLKRPDLWHIFDMWRHKEATQTIDFSARRITPAPEEIKRITKILKEKKYNVLVKNLTTPDVQQAGFFSVRVMVPQLLEMSGAYQFYFNGGNRLFEVPEKLGYAVRSYEQLNPYPHPFP